jgi:hypothetical protein
MAIYHYEDKLGPIKCNLDVFLYGAAEASISPLNPYGPPLYMISI